LIRPADSLESALPARRLPKTMVGDHE